MEFLKKLFRFFFREKVVYTYDMLYANMENFNIVLPDIVTYNKIISKILIDNDLLKNREYKHIPIINRTTIKSTMLSGWCISGVKKTIVNNTVCKDQLLKDVNKEINLFLNLSDKLINQFNKLKEVKRYDNSFKYNIRLLEPFIINIGNIRYLLLIKK